MPAPPAFGPSSSTILQSGCGIHRVLILMLLLFARLTAFSAETRGAQIIYRYPPSGGRLITPETNIIIRVSAPLAAQVWSHSGTFDAVGSISGTHTGETILLDDGRTIIFKPDQPFAAGEHVTVSGPSGVRTKMGEEVPAVGLAFTIQSSRRRADPLKVFEEEMKETGSKLDGSGPPIGSEKGTSNTDLITQVDSVPLDFPVLRTNTYIAPSPGRLFITNIVFGTSIPNVPYLMILDNSTGPVFFRRMSQNCFDFKMQPNELLTYFDGATGCFYALDSNYAVVDSFKCGNGYTTDFHELRLTADGHALLLSYDPEAVDMSTIVAGGSPSATVTGLVIQELDRNKNVIFQWRSWDHYQITDATHENLTSNTIDYVHGNALEIDNDSTILLSCRHMDEITKINRVTGEIIWRWGGKNNQFTILDDSIGFSHQHAVRRIANGDITFFDNGNYHTPRFSRAVEYNVDETNKTARLVWQHRHHPDVYGGAMGYVQRLDNGNTVIGWGSTNPSVTEVAPDGTREYELTMDAGVYSYRAFRYPWRSNVVVASPVPGAFRLEQNFPNPFNSLTTILVSLPREAVVTLRLYDLEGRKVGDLINGLRRGPGEYFMQVDGSSLASGAYFYRLTADEFTQTRKMTLLK